MHGSKHETKSSSKQTKKSAPERKASQRPPAKSQAKSHGTTASAKNEGEGNRTADREYREKVRDFVESADIEREAHAAEEALEGEEGDELRHAEEEGKHGRAH